jgi:hypothetical protein
VSDATWLPNLVAGTSIWKLAVDLNEPKFFDGRLLVPETEGSESLPVTVRWDLTNLIPLQDARASHPDESAAAVKDFEACLARVAKVFSTPNSGFDKYKSAFTVPALDAGTAANYFYSPNTKKLYVINWGASPRSMGGKAEYVFGYEDWAKSWGGSVPPPPMPPTSEPMRAVAPAGAAVAAAAAAKPAEKKAEEKKKDDNARPWWFWPLFGLIAIALVLLALLLLKACEEQRLTEHADAALDAGPDAGPDSKSAAEDAGADAASADAASEGTEAGADAASNDAGADAASADAGSADAGKDGGKGKDGGSGQGADDDDDDAITGSSGGGGGGASGGPVVVKIGPGGGAKTSVHRKHYQDEAVAWRVTQGASKVSRTEQSGHRYDVWLTPGQSFEGVRVEWQDKAGKWHPH